MLNTQLPDADILSGEDHTQINFPFLVKTRITSARSVRRNGSFASYRIRPEIRQADCLRDQMLDGLPEFAMQYYGGTDA